MCCRLSAQTETCRADLVPGDSACAKRFDRLGPRAAIRWLIVFVGLAAFASGANASAPEPSSPLSEALAAFRAEGAKGWSFTQTTEGAGHSRIERYDASQPEFDRWSLLQQDGRVPTAEETQDYHEMLSRRSRGGTAPRLTDQLDLGTVETATETADRITYRFRLKPGEDGDATARFLRATVVVHVPTRTIETFDLAAVEPFSPTLGVKITEMKTTMSYSLPEGDRPSLLQKTTTRLRGRAFFFKSLDADMTVTFTDHEKARRR